MQDVSTVASGLKIVAARLRGTTSDIDDDAESAITNVSKLQSKIKALTAEANGGEGINIINDDGSYKSTYEILAELSKVFDKMDDMSQASLLELVAGKNRSSVVAAILQNGEILKNAYTDAFDSAGSSAKELETHLNSIQGRIDLFNNAVQTMWMNALDSGTIQGFVDAGTTLIQILDGALQTLGLFPTALAAIAAYNLGKIFLQWVAASVKVATAEGTLAAAKKAVTIATDDATRASAQNTQENLKNAMSLKGLGTSLMSFIKSPIGVASIAAAAISLVVTAIQKAKQAQKEAREEATRYAEEIVGLNKTLSDYKDEVDELRNSLDKNTLSEKDAYDAKNRLLEIQKELINKYGKEAEGINLVTGAVKNQIDAISELEKKNAADWLNENSKTGVFSDSVIAQAKEAVETRYAEPYSGFGQGVWTKSFKEKYGNEWKSYYQQAITEYQTFIESLGGYFNSDYNSITFYDITRDELADNYDKIMDWLREYETLNKIDFGDYIGEISKRKSSKLGSDYDTHKKNYEAYLENTAITSYTGAYESILNAEEAYSDAMAAGDSDAAKAAIDNLQTSVASALEQATGDPSMEGYFNRWLDSYAEVINGYDFENAINNNLIAEGFSRGVSTELQDALGQLEGMNAEEILQLKDVDPNNSGFVILSNLADAYGLTIDQLINKLVQLGYVQSTFAADIPNTVMSTKTYTELSESIASYNDLLLQSREILHDDIALSEDHFNALKEQLKDVTVAGEGFADAVDEQNGKVVKNAKLLKQLIDQSRKAKKATIEVAKSQAQLEYNDLVKQIRTATVAMAAEYKAYGYIRNATIDNVSNMRDQLTLLKQTIQQYALLEISLSEAAKSYSEYEAAKERDSKITYDDTFVEMLKTIDEGILNNRTGTEEFEYAVRAIVPETVWEGVEDPDEKIKAIHDYLDGDETFAKLFTVDSESGDLSVTADNVREFVTMCEEAGLVEGSPTGFTLTDKVDGIESFAKELGITEAATLALLSATEDVDALWGNILTDVTTAPLEREVNKQVDAIDTAAEAMENYLKEVQNGEKVFDQGAYKELEADLIAANKAYDDAETKANQNAKTYATLQSAISGYRGEMKFTQQEAYELARSLGYVDEHGQPTISVNDDGTLNLTDEQVTDLLIRLGKLEEPTIMRVQLQYDQLSQDMESLQSYIDNNCVGTIVIDGVTIANHADAEQKLNELSVLKENIEVTYKITETSEEQEKSVLESYQELAKNGLQFEVTTDVTLAVEDLDKVAKAQEKIEPTQQITFTSLGASTVQTAIKNIADEISNLPSSATITVAVKKAGDSEALGNAFASGSIGLKNAENNAIVGEVGSELVNLLPDNLFNCWKTLKLIKLQRDPQGRA